MSVKFNLKMTVLFALSASLLVAAGIIFLLTFYYRSVCFQMMGGVCEKMIQKYPDSGKYILEVLKTQDLRTMDAGENILSAFGYHPSDLEIAGPAVLWIAVLVFLTGGILFFLFFWYWHRKSVARIRALTGYLEKINTGGQGLLVDTLEDEFSGLQDEIYKTVTTLYRTRDDAVTARNSFAENLSNIAHQLKTPVTSISLTVQMAREHMGEASASEIERQINRLTHLEDALLLLSRIDAGTLALDRKNTDVFTMLTLAADNLYELFMRKGVSINIPEMGGTDIYVDPDWTMEAVMNLMKNCMEAAETGTTVHCSYENNPLYVQIRIWDQGKGFEKEDLPYLFERFYRGRRAKENGKGIGIGLSLSKAIIEMQDGMICAFNLPDGGACFEIRFYSH